jgi:heptosyltransferase-2
MAVSFQPPPQRILVRGVNWLGDAVMTTPALVRLRERFPDAHIALLSPEKLKDLYLHHPAVNEVVAFDRGEGLWSVSRKLRPGKFDLAVVFPNSPRSALEAWLAGIPQRIGCARPWRNWLFTRTVPARAGYVRMRKRKPAEVRRLVASPETKPRAASGIAKGAHQLHEYLHLVAALGANPDAIAPCLNVTDLEQQQTAEKFGLRDALSDGRSIFGLNCGAEYGPAKRWPAGSFVQVAIEVQKQTNCHWVIFGAANDGKNTEQVAEQIKLAGSMRTEARRLVYNTAGRTSLRELMALLKSCRLLLTNDTGPMHVAGALGTPVVVPFGSTSPELTGPGLPGEVRHHLLRSDVPCAPCFLRECPIDFRCMRNITVERVTAAVLDIFRH